MNFLLKQNVFMKIRNRKEITPTWLSRTVRNAIDRGDAMALDMNDEETLMLAIRRVREGWQPLNVHNDVKDVQEGSEVKLMTK